MHTLSTTMSFGTCPSSTLADQVHTWSILQTQIRLSSECPAPELSYYASRNHKARFLSFVPKMNKSVRPFNASPRSRPVTAFLDFATPVDSSTRAYIRVNPACSVYTLRAPRGNRWPRERNIPSNPGHTFPRKDRARIQTHIPTEDARRRVRV